MWWNTHYIKGEKNMWEELIFRLVLEIFLELLNTFYTLRRRSPALYNSIMKVCLTDIPRQKKVHIHFQAKMDTCEFISWEGQSQGSVRWASVQEFLNIQQWLWKTAFCFLLSSLANIMTPIHILQLHHQHQGLSLDLIGCGVQASSKKGKEEKGRKQREETG